jgi:hypothetical protein
MGIDITVTLCALPNATPLPARLRLSQTLRSDLPGGESATVTYTIDGGGRVLFEQPDGGTTDTVVLNGVAIPQSELPRVDTVDLVEAGSGAMPRQIDIRQTVQGEENTVHDRVTIAIIL